MTRCAVYTRISQDPKDTRAGVDDQRAVCLKLAERNGWDVLDVFEDNDISGAKDDQGRPAFGRLLAAIKARKVDVVVATKQSRLARDVDVLLDFERACRAGGVQAFRFVSGTDYVLGESRTMTLLQGAMDEDYRRTIAENVRRRKQTHAEQGRTSGGRRPYGYAGDGTVIAHEAERIEQAATAVLEGKSLSAIVRAWNAEQVPTSTGSMWATQTLRAILVNPRYIARRVHQGKVIGDATWPAILDEDTFEDVGAILGQVHRRPVRRGNRYPLKSVLYCHCGHRMTSSIGGRGKRAYRCVDHGTINAEQAERTLFDHVARLADLPRVGQIIRDAEGREDAEARDLRTANAKDAGAIADLLGAVGGDTGLTVADVAPQVRALKAAVGEREAVLANLAGRSALDRFAGRVAAEWDTWSETDEGVQNQRAVLLSLVTKVTVGPVGTFGSMGRLLPQWKVSTIADIDWHEAFPEPMTEDEAVALFHRLHPEADAAS